VFDVEVDGVFRDIDKKPLKRNAVLDERIAGY
jgi:hypothetical protein